MERGVFVLGMHRSGTSAATRLINLLGVPTCVEEDLLPVAADNPSGYWESRSLMLLNDRVLAALDSDWRCPPQLEPGWEAGPRLDELRAEAAPLFARLFPSEEWVWKDPRTCITFPFWTSCLDVDPVAVLVYRNPLEGAESLGRRDGLRKLHLLGLWERYLRLCLAGISGVRTLVTDFSDLRQSPLEWCERVRLFLEDASFTTERLREETVTGFVDPGLRHFRSTVDELLDDPEVSEEQKRLWLALGELHGVHLRLRAPELPPETQSTEVLLAGRRRAYLRERRATELEDRARRLEERVALAEALAARVGDGRPGRTGHATTPVL
jgi:hypothetical protein